MFQCKQNEMPQKRPDFGKEVSFGYALLCSQSVLDNRNIPQTNLFASQVFTRDPALLRENRPKNDYSNLNPNSSAVGWGEVKGCV